LFVPHRPLVLVCGLTLGDYLLWMWSLNANHDVLALVSGLTLPPLVVACLWLLALSLGRLLARSGRRQGIRRARRSSRLEAGPGRRPNAPGQPLEDSPAPVARGGRSSRKLAA
jgi:hypothetical protein